MFTVFLDFETRSSIDLKKQGSYVYTKDESTSVLIAAVGFYYKSHFEVKVYTHEFGFDKLHNLLKVADRIVAHNALFEYQVTNFVLGFDIPIDKFYCTQAQSLFNGIKNASLDNVAKYLGLQDQKDDRGSSLIKHFSLPISRGKEKGLFRPTDAPEFAEFIQYCIQDVRTTRSVYEALPQMSELHWKIWLATQKMNIRGVSFDQEFAFSALNIVDKFKSIKNEEVRALTKGEINTLNQIKVITEFTKVDSLSRDTLQFYIDKELNPTRKRVLELRQQVSNSSISKFKAMKTKGKNGRIHNGFIYHGAYTGRWRSTGVQLQNLPRRECSLEELNDLRNLTFEGLIKKYPDDLLNVLVGSIRSTFLGDPGLIISDFSSIEPRLLFWLIDDQAMLENYRLDKDPYLTFASYYYKKPEAEITKEERNRGKAGFLASMYGGGENGIQRTIKGWGIELSNAECQYIKHTFRQTYPDLVRLWRQCSDGFAQALNYDVETTLYNGKLLIHKVSSDAVSVKLPSNKELVYRELSKASDGAILQNEKQLGVHMIAQNIIQAIAAELMGEALVNLDEEGLNVVMCTHDEVVIESPKSNLDRVHSFMTTPPNWAQGLPMNADTQYSVRYKK
jgi:DNA polymerase